MTIRARSLIIEGMPFSLTPQQKKRLRRGLLGSAILGAATLLWHQNPLTRQLEQATLDYRYAQFNRQAKASDQVAVIDIDEQSMKVLAPAYGRWPWPRRIYKEMIEFLAVGEPSAILFDMLFTEAMLGTDDDQLLAEASKAVGVVSHAINFLEDQAEEGARPKLPEDFKTRFAVPWKAGPPEGLPEKWRRFRDFLLPAPVYLPVIPRAHVVTFDKDRDGVFRRAPMVFNYDDQWLPSLSFAGILSTFREPRVEIRDETVRIEGSDGRKLEIPLDEKWTLPLHYYRLDRDIERIPMGAVIASAVKLQRGEVADPAELQVNPLTLRGKVLLVGASAAGAADLKATPVHSALPGVTLHAIAISNALTKDYLKPLARPLQFAIAFAILLLAYVCVLFAHHILIKVLLPLAVLGGYLGLALYLFQAHSLWLDMALPMFLGVASLLDGFAYISFVEGREKKKLKSTLSKYLPPTVTEQLIATGKDPQAEVGHHEELSILFSDIRGFTTLSETVSPQVLVERLNAYLGRMTDEIFHNDGTLDKFIGDAVMAFWGAPLKDEKHALKAVRTMFGMQKALARLKEEWKAQGKLEVDINIGVGINSGKVIVGNIGSDKRLDYTVIGDNVNLASRIEGLTKQYHVMLLIGERTEELVRDSIVCRVIDAVKVKGKTQHVKIYEPLVEVTDPAAAQMRELAERFAAAFQEYQKGNFSRALELFAAVNLWRPGGDGPSQVYMERCEDLVSDPPKEWDGIYVAKSK